MENNNNISPIHKWAEKINWHDRVKAVCKPCWEIKYCPYGILVETFPLNAVNTEKSCRIYGHDCPVYYVAEPFSETKDLRNITRRIPRVTQFRVMKRENQICQICSTSVKDEDIEFDHVIPWSKGGSSDESNIRLLCKTCNRKKGNSYEEEYLVESFVDHVSKPFDTNIIDFLKVVLTLGHEFYKVEGRYPNEDDYSKIKGAEKTPADIKAAEFLRDIIDFCKSEKPYEIKRNIFEGSKYRWGFIDGRVHTLKSASKKYGIDINDLLKLEKEFLKKMGIKIKETPIVVEKWKKK